MGPVHFTLEEVAGDGVEAVTAVDGEGVPPMGGCESGSPAMATFTGANTLVFTDSTQGWLLKSK